MKITNIAVFNGANLRIFADTVLFYVLGKACVGMGMDFFLNKKGCLTK